MTDKTYNGWANYPTWNTALWIDNEPAMYEEVQSMARQAQRRGTIDFLTPRGRLAETIKDYMEGLLPDTAGFVADLLGYAMGEVDWYEIAEHYIEEIKGDEEEEAAQEPRTQAIEV